MALSDAQIERFSRQIILPQIGGTGQQRLLGASVALAGEGDLGRIAALYLAGAGVGRIEVHRADGRRLADDLVDLDPEIAVRTSTRPFSEGACDVSLACDLPLAELEPAAAVGRPLIAAGTDGSRGWLVVATAEPGGGCASCAARAATGHSPSTSSMRTGGIAWGSAVRPEPVEGWTALSSATAGVVGSMAALSVLKVLLGLGGGSQSVWLQFDAARSTLTEYPITRVEDCPVCR
jgi:adenylyltransferase/sulfurtransferase